MEQNNYDFIIIGAGLSGLSLALAITSEKTLKNKSILIVDNKTEFRNDRTWAYWSDTGTVFDNLASRQWHKLLFSARGWTKSIDLGLYRYRVIRGSDFYEHALSVLSKIPTVKLVQDTAKEILSNTDKGTVVTEQNRYEGNWIFDSAGIAAKIRQREKKTKAALYMRFEGWVIETPEASFDPDQPVFLDFRTDQHEATRFFYVLPYSEKKALVEYTAFVPPSALSHDREGPITEYIKEVLQIEDYSVVEKEQSSLPLRLKKAKRKTGARTLEIGNAGGLLKPTSGFAFTRVMEDNKKIVESLVRKGHPFAARKTTFFYRFADALFMRVMLRYGEHIKGLFYHLFKKNPVSRVFRFLDEKAGPIDCLHIMGSLPIAYFMDSLFFLKKKPYIAEEASAALD